MTALDAVLPALRCPACGGGLRREGQVRCPEGHAYDVARQGHLNLAGPRPRHPGDDPAMVAARARFLGAGRYAPLSEALAAAAVPGLVVDLAGGTGHHLAHVLGRRGGDGLVLDASTAALRAAARAGLAAVGADAWSALPLGDGAATTVLSVFGPRDPAEVARVLAPGGVAVVAGPLPDHLHEVRERLGMLGISPDRADRLDAAFAAFPVRSRATVRFAIELDHAAAGDLVGMTPAARHVGRDELGRRIADLPDRVAVTVAAEVVAYAR